MFMVLCWFWFLHGSGNEQNPGAPLRRYPTPPSKLQVLLPVSVDPLPPPDTGADFVTFTGILLFSVTQIKNNPQWFEFV